MTERERDEEERKKDIMAIPKVPSFVERATHNNHNESGYWCSSSASSSDADDDDDDDDFASDDENASKGKMETNIEKSEQKNNLFYRCNLLTLCMELMLVDFSYHKNAN